VNEQAVRELFLATPLSPPFDGIDVDLAVRRGRRRRSLRQAGTGAGVLVAVGAVAAILFSSMPTRVEAPTSSTSPTTSSSAATTAPPSPAPSTPVSPVDVVAPGVRIPVGAHSYATISKTEFCVTAFDDTGAPVTGTNCTSLIDGNQALGTVGLRTVSSPKMRTILSGVYVDGGVPTAVTVTAAGVTHVATLVRSSARGGHGAVGFFLVWPGSLERTQVRDARVAVYDASGRFLLTM
jgi:hypothetical protein